MDDLRWVLLLAGAIVVAAIYFSSRFESEDWAQERKQFAKNKKGRSGKKSRRKKKPLSSTSVVERNSVKKEPSMTTTEQVIAKPAVSELVVEVTVSNESESEVAELKTIPTEPVVQELEIELAETVVMEKGAPEAVASLESTPQKKEIPNDEINEHKTVEAATKEVSNQEIVEQSLEDEITEIEFPVDLAVAESEISVADTVEDEMPEQEEMPLEIEPLVLSVIVLADDEEFGGPEIKEALEAEGLQHGAMSIFHFHESDKSEITENDDAIFSVANVLEPGYFDLDRMEEIQSPGLMLFCQLPGPLAGDAALEIMLDKGRGLAVRLHGHMCDDKRNRFTVQAKNHYLDRISTFSREMALARSKVPAD